MNEYDWEKEFKDFNKSLSNGGPDCSDCKPVDIFLTFGPNGNEKIRFFMEQPMPKERPLSFYICPEIYTKKDEVKSKCLALSKTKVIMNYY